MATYDAKHHEEAFRHMEEGRKTVYVLLATEDFAGISAGDRLEFGAHGSILIGMVRRYPSLEALLEAQGYQNVVPGSASAEEAAHTLRETSEWDSAQEPAVGVLALRVREAWRKQV